MGLLRVIENGKVYENVKFLVISSGKSYLELYRHARSKLDSSNFHLTEDSIIKTIPYDYFGIYLTCYDEDGSIIEYHVNHETVENGEIHVDVKNEKIYLKNTLKSYIGNVFFQVTIDFKDLIRIESTNRYPKGITQKDLAFKRAQRILSYDNMHNDIHAEKTVNNF